MGRTFKKVKKRKSRISASQSMCPWCGSMDEKPKLFLEGWFRYQCRECGRYYESYFKRFISASFIWFLNIFIIFFTHRRPTVFLLWISGFLFVYVIIIVCKTPYRRSISTKEYEYYPEEFLGIAEMDWLSHREGGLRFPNLTIWNHYILGVCFVDAEGKPVSQTGYIRVNKRLFRKTRKIYQITDNIKYDEKTMSEFVVFYKRKRVGKGRMISNGKRSN